MIETESQRHAAVTWIQYWKASISTGQQSWLSQEQAQETMMALHTQVGAYDKRARRPEAGGPSGDNQTPGPDAALPRPAGTVPAEKGIGS